jgi:hypothetical protein
MNSTCRSLIQIVLLLATILVAVPCRAADISVAQSIAVLTDLSSTNVAKIQACQTLASIGSDSPEAVPALRLQLRNRNRVLRNEAITALAMIGAAAKPAIPDLNMLAESDESPGICTLASEAVASIQLAAAFSPKKSAPAIPAVAAGDSTPGAPTPAAPEIPAVNGFGGTLGATRPAVPVMHPPQPTPSPLILPSVVPSPFGPGTPPHG